MAAQSGDDTNRKVKKYTWVPKVGKNISNRFGVKNDRYAAGFHTGTDIAANEGAKIVWAMPTTGKVIKSGYSKDYGNYVIVKNKIASPSAIISGDSPTKTPSKNLGSGKTLLAHMEHKGPEKGTKLQQGEKIGQVGNTGMSTGPHLHIEQTKAGHKWVYGENLTRPQLVYRADNSRRGAPTSPTLPPPPTSVGTPESIPPTSVGTPDSVPPPTTDSGSGATPPQPPATDPPVDPGTTPPDATDPGATGTTSTDPSNGDPATTDPAAGEAVPDPAEEAATGGAGATGTPPTPDTTDNAGATDPNLDTKPKGMVASKAYLKQQQRVAVHSNDVDISAAAIKSKSILVADRNNDGTVSKKEQRVLNPADRNNNGTVNKKEINKYVAKVDLDKDGKVKPVEAKAFRTLDSNDNNNISKKELKTYRAIAGKDGNASRQEAKQILKAQIDSKQGQREHDMAKELLRRTNEKQGGSNLVGEQTRALAVTETAKRKNNDNDGPGKKKKKNS